MTVTPPSPAQQLEQVLRRYEQAKGTGYDDLSYHSDSEKTEINTSLVAAIERLAPTGTYYYTGLHAAIKQYGFNNNEVIPVLVGIAQALKTAYASGYLHHIEELIRADLFADFLDMSEYLLGEGYKDPTAVIIGGVLEEHLRKLCLKNTITVKTNNRFKKADTMNADLANLNVYNLLDQKNITAWLDLRNKAAHGKYKEYTDEQVKLALQGIRDFIARFPA
jgi:hypothetical protein